MESSLAVLCLFLIVSVYTSASEGGVNNSSLPQLACPDTVPIVEHAEVYSASLKSSYTKGDKLLYNCQQGYLGKIMFICDGHKWVNRRNAECSRKRCALPADIQNGHFMIVNGSDFVYGTTIKYVCKKGYRMASVINTRTCLAGGWNNHLPECEEIVCSPPVTEGNIIVDGHYEDSTLRYGHRLQFACHSPELKLVGPRQVTCEENGEWSSTFPTCEEVMCELEKIDGRVTVVGIPKNNEPIKYGHKLHFYCTHREMALRGSKESTCSTEGKWSSPFPICEVVTCKEGQLNNVIIVAGYPGIVPPFKPGHNLRFQCDNYYLIMMGESSITCRNDGTWSSPYPTCEAKEICRPPPRFEFADLTNWEKSYYYNGETVEYKCQHYYTMESHPYLSCTQGRWTGDIKCLKPCILNIEDMDARNIQQFYGEKRKMYSLHGQQIRFACQYGRWPKYMEFYPYCVDGIMQLPVCQ